MKIDTFKTTAMIAKRKRRRKKKLIEEENGKSGIPLENLV